MSRAVRARGGLIHNPEAAGLADEEVGKLEDMAKDTLLESRHRKAESDCITGMGGTR